jgi:integrase
MEDQLLLGEAWHEQDLMFCTAMGTPLMDRNLLRSLYRLLELAELPRERFHDLRHTCATLALSANVNPTVVSEMLGHSTVATTPDSYSHVLPDMQEDAASIIGALLYG